MQFEDENSDVDSRTLQKLKKKKLKRLCSLLAMGRENLDPEARTLVFLQVQQIQGSPYPDSSQPVSADQTSANSFDCHSLGDSGGSGGLLGNHFGGGGLLGGGLLGSILGGGAGGLLGNTQSDLNPGTLGDLAVRPERYLRPLYRSLRPLVRFFKK